MYRNETVLVIDDRQDSIDFLTNYILQPAGYTISLALDGEQGLHKALEEKPDLIIMDLKMPKLSGIEVLESLRKAQSDIPVILMTFHGSEQAAVQAFRLGAKDYVIKPYKVEEMQGTIERALAESRLRRERDHLADNVTTVNRRMERRVKELNVLSGIGKSVTALLDEDRLLTRIVEAAVYITGAEEGFLLLEDKESGELFMRAARGLGEKYARGFRLKVDDSLAGQVMRTGKPIMITGSQQGDQFKVKTGYLVKSLLHVPLRVGDTIIGVLSVDHMLEDQTFDDHDLYLLSALADYAAIALANSRLYAQLQQRLQDLSGAGAAPPQPMTTGFAASESFASSVRTFVQEGQARLSDLREQVALLETWLKGVEPQQLLGQLGDQGPGVPGQAAPSSPTPDILGQKLGDILDSIVDGVLVIDQNDQIVMANSVAEQMLGDGLVGKPIDDICDDPRWGKTYHIVQTAAELTPNTPGSEITSALTPLSVAHRMLRASFRIMFSKERKPTGIIAVLRDVDAEREAQRAKDSFIAAVSQELRTPVTSIRGYADLLLSESVGMLRETQRKFLDRIQANARRMSSLLNNLEGMTVIDSRQLEIKTEAMDIVSVIQQTSDALRPQVAEKDQTLELSLHPDLPTVQADPDAVYHVLTSLLKNAHHCSPEKTSIRLEARRMLDEKALYVLVSVTDAGGGVAPEDHKRVFNRFYRSDDPTVPGLGDSGVELSIVKVLVEAHGGRVWLDSEMGVGSTFTFILPVHRDMSGPQIAATVT